jgi:Cytochrome P460
MRAFLLAMIFMGAGLMAGEVTSDAPRFTADNQLIRPEGYRQWMFLSSGLGMSYRKDADNNDVPVFTNTYIRPEAYRQFAANGTFPEGTVLVLELYSATREGSINKRGNFQDRFIGIEASVKDSKRFAEKWAYFNFMGDDDKPLAQADPFPKKACWTCHNKNGAADNVFVQFYPILREAQAKRNHP